VVLAGNMIRLPEGDDEAQARRGRARARRSGGAPGGVIDGFGAPGGNRLAKSSFRPPEAGARC
jgi:hypothetical protein